ncbi:hypothetical protein BU17DRAFT_64190 [Hysterangium stoloniferum]|nr:hypothetical protein BU17DRAFT_64190 [Hysterangium stoloniferum]
MSAPMLRLCVCHYVEIKPTPSSTIPAALPTPPSPLGHKRRFYLSAKTIMNWFRLWSLGKRDAKPFPCQWRNSQRAAIIDQATITSRVPRAVIYACDEDLARIHPKPGEYAAVAFMGSAASNRVSSLAASVVPAAAPTSFDTEATAPLSLRYPNAQRRLG